MAEEAPSGMKSTDGSDGSKADRQGEAGYPNSAAGSTSGQAAPQGSQGGDSGKYGSER